MNIDPEFESEVYALLLDEGDSQQLGSKHGGASQTFLDSITLGEDQNNPGNGLKRKNREAFDAVGMEDKHRRDREMKRQKNSGDLFPQKPKVRDPNAPYDVLHADKKKVAEGVWHESLGVVELSTLRGNFWRVTGYTANSRQLLNPEEALLLVEKSLLIVRPAAVLTDAAAKLAVDAPTDCTRYVCVKCSAVRVMGKYGHLRPT